MITENLTTLKINNLTQAQYDAALAAGTINENEIYATPDNNELDTTTFLRVSDVGSAVDTNPINADTLGGKSASEFLTTVDKTELNNSINTNKTELNNSISTKAPLASPAFTGSATVAAGTDYTTAKLRNVILSTENPSGGNNGDIWIKYKV